MSHSHSPRQYWVWRAFDEQLALRLPRRALFCLAGLFLLLVTIFAISVLTGSYGVPWGDVFATLTGATVTTAIDNVVWEFRLPRMLVAAMVGAMMALSGAALQNVTRNGLADPSLVGVSQGAALAVVSLVIAFPEVSPSLRPISAFAGAMAAAILVQFLSTGGRRHGSSIRFILLGIGVAAFISSITTALLTYGDIQRATAALTWMAGSINAASWSDVWLLAGALLVLLPILLGISRQIAALQMGEDLAVGLGAPVRFARYALITLAVAMAAIATAVVGPLAFVGLIAPHAARRLAHAGIGLTLIITAMTGAVLVSGADLLGRALFAPLQIPAGIVTAVIGVPIFVYLLWGQAAHGRR
jgi:iron complex transport system permease protein